MKNHRQSWYARCRYPGLQEFIFGTVWGDGMEEARTEMSKAIAATLPALPDILAIEPGVLVLVVDGDDVDVGVRT